MWRGGFYVERRVRRDEEVLCGDLGSMWIGGSYVESSVLCEEEDSML
jgi:hypothetical protein